jgi:hypothetical protein
MREEKVGKVIISTGFQIGGMKEGAEGTNNSMAFVMWYDQARAG